MNKLHLFQGYGVELEYMIVNRQSLEVVPISDLLLQLPDGNYTDEVEHGAFSWSNELVMHVIELKTNGPAVHLKGLSAGFHEQVKTINKTLGEKAEAMLLPTAMHPWMDPFQEARLWTHERNEIYEKYNEIFDCRGHGWSNLQSVHLNLPFFDDTEFALLHNAIRLLLPLLPGLAASSPFANGQKQQFLDYRLAVYKENQKRVPSISGAVIPEQVSTAKQYQEQILQKIYRDIAPLDPEGLLQHEWLNSRGAITRFDRNTIEIRVLDIQEAPKADLAILQLIDEVLHFFIRSAALHAELSTGRLAQIFTQSILNGEDNVILDQDFLHIIQYPEKSGKVRDIWSFLLENAAGIGKEEKKVIEYIIKNGTLASRILKSTGNNPTKEGLKSVYTKIADCLDRNQLFEG